MTITALPGSAEVGRVIPVGHFSEHSGKLMYPLRLKPECDCIADVFVELVASLLKVSVFVDVLEVGAEGAPLGCFLRTKLRFGGHEVRDQQHCQPGEAQPKAWV